MRGSESKSWISDGNRLKGFGGGCEVSGVRSGMGALRGFDILLRSQCELRKLKQSIW